MAKEIERKFLLKDDSWKKDAVSHTFCRQAYIPTRSGTPHATVRVRIMGDQAFLTLKGAAHGISRSEFEYPIPVSDAMAIMEELCGNTIEKTRYIVFSGDGRWEVDEFSGANKGLSVAEIELASEDAVFERPSWLGEEVTGNHRYSNSNLVTNPYSTWEKLS